MLMSVQVGIYCLPPFAPREPHARNVLYRIFRHMDCSTLVGTIVAIPVCNPHGYVRYQRGFRCVPCRAFCVARFVP